MMQSARRLWRTTAAALSAYFVLALALWPTLPERIPLHFGFDGTPDIWVDTSLPTWFFLPVVAAGLVWMTWALSRYSRRYPEATWSGPERDRFLALDPADRAPILATVDAYSAFIALLVTILFAALQVGVYTTARGRTAGLTGWIGLVHIAVLLAILLATFFLYRRLRKIIRSKS